MTVAHAPSLPAADPRLDDLAQIIRAYNDVTEKLQQSHEALRGEVARLQQELASTDAQLQRSRRLAALGEMAAGIAHEIRNPLAAIQLYVNVLQEDLPAGTPPADIADRIAHAVRGLEAIVTDVLHFSREMQPALKPLSVGAIFGRALEAHRPAIDASGVKTVLQVPQPPPFVLADANLIHQAVLNLVRNAVDAMNSGGTLHLQTRVEPKLVTMIVRDSGPGIREQDIDRIFNPFFTTRNTGTGLGLAIVHRIVDAHGGTISAHNEGGAVFELTLPRVPAAAPTTVGVSA